MKDEPIMQTALKFRIVKGLPNYDVTVDIADNGKIGVEKFQSGSYDIIIMDMQVPVMNGIEAIARIRIIDPHIPIIALLKNDNERHLPKGINSHLTKPFRPAELVREITNLLSLKPQYKVTSKELNTIKKRFKLASQEANFGYWEIDIVTNEMNWSDEVYKIFGFELGRITPSVTDYLNFVYAEDRERVQNTFSEALKDSELRKIEYRIRVGTAPIKYVENYFQMYFDSNSGQTLLVGVLCDITESKRSEELIEQHNLSKGTSHMKEEILKDMSSRIRGPLASITNISYLLDNSQLNEEQKELAEALLQSVSDLSLAINNLLNFSVLLSDKVIVEEEQFTITDTIRGLVKMFQIKANRKSIILDVEIDEDLPKYLIGDEKKLTQILYYLLDNAVKYTEHDGRIEFEVQAKKIEMDKANISFCVEDNGIGMSKEKVKEILNTDRLLNLTQVNNKKGFGLAIATFLAQKMRGELKAVSEEGEGTTFTVDIEFSIADVAAQEIGGDPIRPMRILFVEDHFLNQIATKRMLTMWSDSISVDIADNGKIGFEKFEANDYDIILMDLHMPIMNGFEASAGIRTIHPDIPIIALSSNPSKTEAEKCFDIGINDYLAKPYNPEDLKDMVMNLLS